MNKMGMLALAFALIFGFAQCKKENQPTPEHEGEKVNITLNVGGGNRVDVSTETGEVTFEDGDVIYVANNGVFVGTLTYNGTQFSGDITDPTEGQKLHFYFLGNVDPTESLTEGSSTTCSVVISDQRTKLPVISYAPSRENYETGRTAYNATLLNKCALVKFNVTTISEAATCITGLNNKVTVDFATNELAYSQDGAGSIALPAGNGERWAILLPQDEVTDAVVNSYDGLYAGTCGTIPAIAANDYLTEGIVATIDHRAGVINGKFTIDRLGYRVYFSKGNLQYIGSAGNGDDNNTGAYWKFADHQWDYFGTTTGQNSDSKTVDRDLFGWGTSGCFYNMPPWSIGTNDADYFAYGNRFYSLYDADGSADWGYNAISNGGNTRNSGWRTLKYYEWSYVFNTRSTTSGIRWAFGIVNGINGVILLPDDWIPSIYALNDPNGGDYPSNTITAEDWVNVLEANGAVFLPAANSRVGTTVQLGLGGNYWSASRHENELFFAKCLIFIAGSLEAEYGFFFHRGLSVRLVLDVE